jgi:hypothetical protein
MDGGQRLLRGWLMKRLSGWMPPSSGGCARCAATVCTDFGAALCAQHSAVVDTVRSLFGATEKLALPQAFHGSG